ncbi:MAG TPA: DUF2927 domain-containing protein [Stellaceae bacterium]|jgi:hypothetical protein|nr:DUF2927 domain-containing protein [Stellaceae bacterium]
MSIRSLALWAFVALSIGGCAPAPAPGLPPDRLARFFSELVYGNPAEPEGVSPTLLRWTQPGLIYAVGGERAPGDDARIASTLERFSRLTGLSIVPGEAKHAQLTIDFEAGPMAPVHDELARCYTRIVYTEAGLQWAHVVVNTETPGTLAACLDHEFMHAFGFPHHSPIMPSVMSPFRRIDTLSAADQAALAALYDPRLKAGMTREAAAPALGSVIVAHAQTTASSATLFSENPGRAAADLEWHAVFSNKTALAFNPPGLDHAVSHHYWAAAPNGSYVAEVSLWSAIAAERPRATVRYIRLRDRLAFAHALRPEEMTLEWRAIADSGPSLTPSIERQTPLGLVRFAEAATTQGPCMVFVADIREDNVEHSRGRIDGYYCARTGMAIDAAAVLDALALRAPGYSAPSLQLRP